MIESFEGQDKSLRRVRRPEDKQELLARLTAGGTPFETYRDAMMFAASLGYEKQKRAPFSKSAEPIPWQYFVDGNCETFINMLAAAVTRDPQILSRERHGEKLTIFEEYANGGLGIIAGEIANNAISEPLDVICDLANGQRGTSISDADLQRLVEGLAE